jgi:hypothetical protein
VCLGRFVVFELDAILETPVHFVPFGNGTTSGLHHYCIIRRVWSNKSPSHRTGIRAVVIDSNLPVIIKRKNMQKMPTKSVCESMMAASRKRTRTFLSLELCVLVIV